jgi:hypothetical protein
MMRTGSVSTQFGYYPAQLDVDTNRFSIRTLPGHESIVASVESDPHVAEGWIYPGAHERHDFMSSAVRYMPYSARIFGLPKTHTLTLHQNMSEADLTFVVWCLSFFAGMRLTTTEAGFLDATPIQRGKLVDFTLVRCTLADAAGAVLDYLESDRADPRGPKRVAAAVHALFIAQYPQSLPFEEFQYLYIALDTCFALARPKAQILHGKRIEWMCQRFNIPLPTWANSAQIPAVRNDAFHEALFFGEPLGFSIAGGDQSRASSSSVTLQMRALVCRILVSILVGPNVSYVQTSVDSRQRYALELPISSSSQPDR